MAPDGALPAGSLCGGYEIVRVIGTGGFGIVYLARDPLLHREVAIKEYMPRRLATREAGSRVVPGAGACADTYADGLRAFIAEARLLARFDHPSLVHVHRFWEDNATAYMAMPWLAGSTLHRARQRLGRAPDPAWMRGLADAITQALDLLHGAGVLHRDVAPDNILLPPQGPPVLLDMGAARASEGDGPPEGERPALHAVKRGYAAAEQYRRGAALSQGPWTDLYGLGAVLHFLFCGRAPLPPLEGGFDARNDRPAGALAGEGADTWALMAWMLEAQPEHRPQSVAELRARWGLPRCRASSTWPGISGPAI